MSFLKTIQKKKGKKWLILGLVLWINFLIFFIIMLSVNEYWGEVNVYVSGYVGFYINIVLIVLIIYFIPFIYGIILFCSNIKQILKSDELKPHIMHKIIPVILLSIFNAIFYFILYLLGSLLNSVLIKLEFFQLWIFLPLCTILIIFTYPVLKYIPIVKSYFTDKFLKADLKAILLLILIVSIYAFAFLYPIFFIPASILPGKLPSKPDLIGHRGGAHIGPENTIEAAEVALNYDIIGWEVDIGISYDGVPFLMHDGTLKRTTNVEEVFPDKQDDQHYDFKWKEIKQLNAGSWFVKNDPYGVIAGGFLSEKQIDTYKDAKIPSFEEVLKFTNENDIILDFDTRRPPEDHPYHDDFLEILLNMTIDIMDDLENIMIPTSDEEWLDLIKENDAKDIWTYKDYANTGDGYTNAEYRAAYEDDFPIMVYTIDSKERFSQLWSLGVKWVKTDTPHLFYDMDAPLWSMPLEIYVIIWMIVYIALGANIVLIKAKFLNKENVVE